MRAIQSIGVLLLIYPTEPLHAPIVVEEFYTRLLYHRRLRAIREGNLGVAYALHDAVGRLRGEVGPKNLERWAPFVHFGN